MMDVGDGEERNCDEALRAIYLFLDREMPVGDRAKVQEHLDDCLPCLEAYEFETELKQLIANKCKEEVPPHLVERVKLTLQAEFVHDVNDVVSSEKLADDEE
jgi:mycothiol system anti-sigma-R factor